MRVWGGCGFVWGGGGGGGGSALYLNIFKILQ